MVVPISLRYGPDVIPHTCLTSWYHDCNGACNLECCWAVGRSVSPTAPTHEMEGQRLTQGAETLERGWAHGWGITLDVLCRPRVMH
jgi:hypothetical protein